MVVGHGHVILHGSHMMRVLHLPGTADKTSQRRLHLGETQDQDKEDGQRFTERSVHANHVTTIDSHFNRFIDAAVQARCGTAALTAKRNDCA